MIFLRIRQILPSKAMQSASKEKNTSGSTALDIYPNARRRRYSDTERPHFSAFLSMRFFSFSITRINPHRLPFLPFCLNAVPSLVVASCMAFVSGQERKLTHCATPPLPNKSDDFSGTLKYSAALLRSLSIRKDVIAKSYPIQPVIQLSTGVWGNSHDHAQRTWHE